MGQNHTKPEEQALLWQLYDVLESAECLEDLRKHAYPLLAALVAADLGALCSWRPETQQYDWVGDLPEDWFAAYPEIARHDFVREAVSRRPYHALVDAQMIEQRAKERSLLYQRSRDFSLNLEHALSVLLTQDGCSIVRSNDWHGGLTFYRTRRVPFAEREATILQQMAMPFARAFQRCQRLERALSARDLEAWLLRLAPLEAVALDREGRELARTPGATALLAAWKGYLPDDWLARITNETPGEPSMQGRDFVQRREGKDAVLLGWVYRRPFGSDIAEWAIALEERSRYPALPSSWERRFKGRMSEVARRVIWGFDNQQIATELGCSEPCIKQDVRKIFDALGVPSRTKLCSLAYEEVCLLRSSGGEGIPVKKRR